MKERLNSDLKISSQKAVKIATERSRKTRLRWIKVYSDLPENVQIYPRNQATGCWSVMMGEEGGKHFRGSRLICISQKTGMVVYDGPAGDEG